MIAKLKTFWFIYVLTILVIVGYAKGGFTAAWALHPLAFVALILFIISGYAFSISAGFESFEWLGLADDAEAIGGVCFYTTMVLVGLTGMLVTTGQPVLFIVSSLVVIGFGKILLSFLPLDYIRRKSKEKIIADPKRYGVPIVILTLMVYLLGVSGVTTTVKDYHSFAFFALVSFTLTVYAFVISSNALSDPYGGKIADVSCFFGTLCMIVTFMFGGLTIVAVNLTGLPTRLTLLSLWPLSLIIIGAVITGVSVRGMISVLRTGPLMTKKEEE